MLVFEQIETIEKQITRMNKTHLSKIPHNHDGAIVVCNHKTHYVDAVADLRIRDSFYNNRLKEEA